MKRINRKCGCGEYGCLSPNTCKIQCRHCKGNLARAHMFSHRCIVVGPEKCREFWQPGDDETGANPKPKLWAYDIESTLTVIPGTTQTFRLNFEKDGFVQTETCEYVMDEVFRYKHKPTLVIARNVFEPFDTEPISFRGDDALLEFIRFMNTHNSGDNICFAHNAQGYDSRLISTTCREHYDDNSIREVSCLARGNKFLEIALSKVRFRDSMCFLVGGLANLAKSYFPNDNVRKGDFPHVFNKPENFGYVGDVPPKEFYSRHFGAKSSRDAKEFDDWYAAEVELKRGIWSFDYELEEYCKNDVLILAKLMKEFHDIAQAHVSDTENVSSPWFSVTAPSWVHKTIKRKIYPLLELEQFENTKSDEYMEHVQTLAEKETWAVLVENEYWFARLALRGGRTEVRRIYHKLTDDDIAQGKRIWYQDIVSMYPYVQVAFDYPVGTPVIEIYDPIFYPCYKHKAPPIGNIWSKACPCTLIMKKDKLDARLTVKQYSSEPKVEQILADESFFGIVCATMQPPDNLFHPVLVHYDHDMKKCVGSLNKIEQGVFTSVEFVTALKHGYKLIQLHRVDRYKKAPGLWNEFIKELYMEKMSNAGNTPPQDQWEDLINAYEEGFEMGNMVRTSLERGWGNNPAKKQTAKISINSGWGKHCQRPNMPVITYIEVDKVEDMLIFDKNIQEGIFNLKSWHFLGNQTRASHETNGTNGRIDLHDSYLPAGLFVPAYGRMMLWEQLNKLGDRVLMHDTDSIVYIHDPNAYNIPESGVWGGWEREDVDKKNGGLVEYIGLGPKSYAIRSMNDKVVIKNKGVSLKHAHRDIVSFEKLRDMVLAHMNNQEIVGIKVPQMRFQWTLDNPMETQEYCKKLIFTPKNLKGVLDKETGILYPFGWKF